MIPTKYQHLIDACGTNVDQLIELQQLVYLAGLGNAQTGEGEEARSDRSVELCWFSWHLGVRTAEVSRSG